MSHSHPSLFLSPLQDDVSSALFPSGANLNLLVLTVVTASAAAALLVIGLVALCVRRRNKASKMKKADAAEAERGKAQEEYQVRKDVGDFIPRFTARFELCFECCGAVGYSWTLIMGSVTSCRRCRHVLRCVNEEGEFSFSHVVVRWHSFGLGSKVCP